ncbi:MAG: glycoside hydrolase family 1 protein [Deltaproteobacteria bacterium]|nr:glycoside hydrolase family 1 protein [Deltaproteobacteria bacterium]
MPTWLTQDIAFPADFVWGTASSSHQAEGNNVHNDWWDWEQQPGRIVHGQCSGRGNNFYERYDGDFSLLAHLGLNQFRLSLEWSRIEPEEGRIDSGAVDHYRRVLEAAQRNGITPWVNLHHFALPRWFAAKGGFLEEANLSYWRRHVERVTAALATFADHWHPINEANAYAGGSYLLGAMPPGHTDLGEFQRVLRNTLLMYRDAYQILKTARPQLQVGTIHVMIPVFPANPDDESDRLLAANFDGLFNAPPLLALRDGVIALPGREPETVADLKGAADFFGANYYCGVSVDHRQPMRMTPYPPGQTRLNQIGNGVYPEGLFDVLQRVQQTNLGIPIYVAENGTGTDDDCWRIEYIAQHLVQVKRAIDAGCDVRGYFHWTSVDNFEWNHGWTAPFGLIGFDPVTFERKPRPSAHFLSLVAKRNSLRISDVREALCVDGLDRRA